ncbi:efflux RND transporter periplasmic adaptor subunit [candidate division KSB1 bacterium]|nr:efflux RND transporter periplasmic adaptor subunit [candidate division KSB1 bacterium]
MKKKIGMGLGVLFALFFIWRIVAVIRSGSPSAQKSGRPPVAVQTDSVRTGAIRDVREYTGSVHALYQYVVAPKVSGRIVEMTKRIGDWVDKGERIVVMDGAEYQQALAEAEANLKIARASLAEAQSQFALSEQELERVRSLQEKGIASPAELDAATTNNKAQQSRLELAKAQVEQREAALQSARIRLSYTTLSASQPGFIGERFVDEGSLLAPNTPVLTIIGIDTVIVRTTIIERDYGRIQIGQAADVIVDAFPGTLFPGRVSRIAPMLQEASRMAAMELVVPNPGRRLKPGMFARVRVVLVHKDSARIVPSAAIISKNGQSGLYLLPDSGNQVRYTPVEIGISNNEWSEILSPPVEGRVITLGQHLLEEGSTVILPDGKEE